MHCPQCGSANDADAAFCENCGAKLERLCRKCGAPLKPGARFCKHCGSPASYLSDAERLQALQTAAPPELQQKIRSASQQMQGERKPVTILFTDIVGSTSLAEKLDPEEWKEIVSGAHQRVSQAVYRYEGTIAQLLGDGVLAFFGAPITHEDDPLRAARAALDIQDSMADYERQLKDYLDSFQMRIGVNTGIVVVGSVGSDLHMEYLAIGDAVNLAARLQSAAQPGKVLLSESTARLVQAAFDLQPMGQVSLKGKSEPVRVFELVGRKDAPESRRGFDELRSPLVGRQVELAALRSALQQLQAGLGHIVSITGEAGIGKSRLVEEACRAPDQGSPNGYQNLHWLEGRALSYGQQLSFWTIRQLLFNDLGLSDGDPEPRLHLALRKRVGALFGGEVGEASRVLPYLGSLLGIRLEDEMAERVDSLDGETLKYQTFLAITRYFSRLAELQPTVLVFDDLHWADPSSLEALEGLLPLTDRAPILLLLLSRQEREHPSWQLKLKAGSQYAHRYTDITLQPLSGDEQNQLVDNLLAIDELPQPVRQRILERAEGNPFFMEEIVRHLIEQQVIVRQEEGWQAADGILNVTIPDTLRGVLLARIDRLQEDVRRTLQLAAVIGKSFLYRLLEAIAEAETQLERHLAQLQRSDLVREKTRLPELEYMFKHSLTQEAAYQSLLLEQRREFHRRVGQALEQVFAGREEEYFGLLAHHFEAAGEAEKAITYLIQAGDKARLTDEHLEAVAFYQRALELLSGAGDESRAAQVWLKLGLVHNASFQFEAAYQAYENAFAFSQKKTPIPQSALPTQGKLLRLMVDPTRSDYYDPGKAYYSQEIMVILCLFSGLVRVDEALNVVPDVARSWQVLEGGKRYRFHLRQDVRWTDGTPVTAHNFAWAWKRNLLPSFSSPSTQLLYAVAGAQDYHEGRNSDPESVGVRALDSWTLQVDLVKPVAYFPFLMALPVSYPLPRAAIERYGDDWWHAGHILSNGAFQMVEFNPETGVVMEHNPSYHGEFLGNIHRIEVMGQLDPSDPLEPLRLYQDNRTDIIYLPKNLIPADIPAAERVSHQELITLFIGINPLMLPFEDVRLRRALSLALDREGLFNNLGIVPAEGGLVPPGMPGHSPGLWPGYDPGAARVLLAEAGFPNGARLPVFKAVTYPQLAPIFSEVISQWRGELGIHVELELSDRPHTQTSHGALVLQGWAADHPDPDNFLRQTAFIDTLNRMGWQDKEYEALVETALSLSDRGERMRLYRQADRLLVAERVLVLPVDYSSSAYIALVKPWVKNFKIDLLAHIPYNQIIVEDH